MTTSKRRIWRLADMADLEKLPDLLNSLTPQERLFYGLPPKKRGRRRDISKWETWEMAAFLRNDTPRLWSWRKLTRHFDPEGYKQDPVRATDRMRQGILSVLAKAKEGC